MNVGQEALRRVIERAEDRHGLVGRHDAYLLGVTKPQYDSAVRNGRLQQVAPGVHRVAGAPRTLAQARLAAVMSAGGAALLGGFAAAHQLRIADPTPATIEVTIPYGATSRTVRIACPPSDPLRSELSVVIHRTLRLDRTDRVVADGVPCTTAARTLLDLAGRVDDDTLEEMYDRARRLGLVSPRHLLRQLVRLGGRGAPGCGQVRALLERQRGLGRAESPLETRLWRLLGTARFVVADRPARQLVVTRGDGRAARLDVAWEPLRYGVEAEGWEWHSGRMQWKRDRRRTATLEAAGWRLTFVTWADVVDHGPETLARVQVAYEERARLARPPDQPSVES